MQNGIDTKMWMIHDTCHVLHGTMIKVWFFIRLLCVQACTLHLFIYRLHVSLFILDPIIYSLTCFLFYMDPLFLFILHFFYFFLVVYNNSIQCQKPRVINATSSVLFTTPPSHHP